MLGKASRIILHAVSFFFFLGFLAAFFSGYEIVGCFYFLTAFLMNPLPFSFVKRVLSNKAVYLSISAVRFLTVYFLVYFNMVQNQVETGDKVRQIYSNQISGYVQPPLKKKTP